MSWSHLFILVIAVVGGYWLHAKMPGLLTKGTGGIIAA